MKCLLSAPPLLVAITSATLFYGSCAIIAHAEEPPSPPSAYVPVNSAPNTDTKTTPALQLQKPSQEWEYTINTLQNDPALTMQLNKDPQLTQALSAVISQGTAAEQKRLQDAQAAVQKSQSQLDAAMKKLNATRALSPAERATQQEQISKLRQELSQNMSRLKARQTAQTELQTKLKQLQSTGLSWSTTLLEPQTPALTLPQSRNLLYTPADATTLIKRNLLLKPEDRAAVKVTPLHK